LLPICCQVSIKKTAGGKIFSSVIIFIRLGIVAVPAGLIASAFSDIFKNKE